MQQKLAKMSELVSENCKEAQIEQKRWYDRNARKREFAEGDQVLVLLPTITNKLMAKWQHCAKTLLYDSVFYSVYLNIHLKHTHQRIEPYTQVRIFKYNRSRDICGCLANR